MSNYYPILLSKEGELVALEKLSHKVKSEVAPVLEILFDTLIDGDGDYKTKIQDCLMECWSFDDNKIFLDFTWFEDINGNVRSIKKLFTELRNSNVNAIPVIAVDSPTSLITLVQQIVAKFDCEVGIRLNDRNGGIVNYNTELPKLIKSVNSVESNCTIILDLEYLELSKLNLSTSFAVQFINSLYSITEWVDVVVAAGSFLADLGGLTPPASSTSKAIVHRLPRFEWRLWKNVISQKLPREIKYGDFGTKNPIYLPAGFEGSASIKYTVEKEFVIYRGKKASEHSKGGGQYNDSAKSLIGSADFSGKTFSWGDEQIDLIGNRTTNPGNSGTWVKISQNHHITLLNSLL